MWIAPAVPALFAHNVPPWASSLTQAAALVGWGGGAELTGSVRDLIWRAIRIGHEPSVGVRLGACLARVLCMRCQQQGS